MKSMLSRNYSLNINKAKKPAIYLSKICWIPEVAYQREAIRVQERRRRSAEKVAETHFLSIIPITNPLE